MLGFIYHDISPPYGRLKLSLIPGDPHTGNRRDVPAPPTGSAYQNGSNLVYIEWYGTGKIPELATTGEPETMLPRAITDADALSLKPF